MKTRIITILLIVLYTSLSAQVNFLSSYSVENYAVLNTPNSELQLMPFGDAQILISNREVGKNKQRTFGIYQVDANGKVSDMPSEINTKHVNGSVAVVNAHLFYFSKTNKNGQIDPKTGQYIRRLGIYKAEFINDQWKVKVISEFTNKNHSYAHPSISKDGKTMFFVSDMKGGVGKTDIYKSELKGEHWSKPLNLGHAVNTTREEEFPFYHNDGFLFFSSRGHKGHGGLDVFVTQLHNEVWEVPQNMGEPMNSRGNEFSVYLNEELEKGFLISNRFGGRGSEDVYLLTEELINKNDSKIEGLEEKVSAINDLQLESVNMGKTADNSEEQRSPIRRRKEIILHHDQQIKLMTEQLNENNLDNIYFDIASTHLNNSSKQILNQAASILKGQQFILQLHAHADAQGDFHQNVRLSEKRARSVMQYLFSLGIPMDQIHYLAYGESELAVDEAGEELLNRRVAFQLLPKWINNLIMERKDELSVRQINALEPDKYYVQLAAISQNTYINSNEVMLYGTPMCYFDRGMYKYVYGPFNDEKSAQFKQFEVKIHHQDAFIYFNEADAN